MGSGGDKAMISANICLGNICLGQVFNFHS